MIELNKIYNEDCLLGLKSLPDCSVDCCVTSPPYYGLRDYGVEGQIGLEETPDQYVQKLVEVFHEVKRVLKDDGTLWLNLGDSYNGQTVKRTGNNGFNDGRKNRDKRYSPGGIVGLKPKDLIGIPWMVAFALRSDGWWLRQDIIWCLSGGTWLYAKTQKGEAPIMVKDIARLEPSTVKLWNGDKWTQLLGMSKSHKRGDELEIVLRSGERISCTPTHKWPTSRGIIQTKDLVIGDVLLQCQLPDTESPNDCVIDNDAAWFAGLYLAEGSTSGNTIQIAGHKKETERWNRVKNIAKKFGGSATMDIKGNCMNIRVYGKILFAILSELVGGKTAKDKCLSPVVWKYSNSFIESFLDGYLSGDGHWDESNKRWRLVFTRNYNLERDLRTICARLGYTITLIPSSVLYNNEHRPTFKGEIRKTNSSHFNRKDRNEIMKIRKARCRYVYDLGVADEPHLFSLASGVLTHNCKPNPMPESVTDRCTKSHEYIFLLSKSQKYYYDYEAIKEDAVTPIDSKAKCGFGSVNGKFNTTAYSHSNKTGKSWEKTDNRNKRSVWIATTRPFREAHFATFPPKLIEPCILSGCPEGGTVLDPFMGAGTTALVARKLGRNYIGFELNPGYIEIAEKRLYNEMGLFSNQNQGDI